MTGVSSVRNDGKVGRRVSLWSPQTGSRSSRSLFDGRFVDDFRRTEPIVRNDHERYRRIRRAFQFFRLAGVRARPDLGSSISRKRTRIASASPPGESRSEVNTKRSDTYGGDMDFNPADTPYLIRSESRRHSAIGGMESCRDRIVCLMAFAGRKGMNRTELDLATWNQVLKVLNLSHPGSETLPLCLTHPSTRRRTS